MNNNFSLLWPLGAARECKRLSGTVSKDLSLYFLCEDLAKKKEETAWLEEQLRQIPSQVETIAYRQQIFKDLYENEKLTGELDQALMTLRTLQEFQTYKVNAPSPSNMWTLINQLKELQVYVEAIVSLRDILDRYQVKAKGLQELGQSMDELCEDSGFEPLRKDIQKLADDVSKIKSLQLGINLDEDLKSSEVVLLSVDEEVYSGEHSILDSFMGFLKNRAEADNGNFSSLVKQRKREPLEADSVMLDLTKQMEGMLGDLVKKMSKVLRQYVDLKGYYVLELIPELTFYLRMVELIKKCETAGLPVCCPKVVDSDKPYWKSESLYNIRLLLHMLQQNRDAADEMVVNDLDFNENQGIFLLTGPNRGGKTIITQAVGLITLLASQGVYVPAKSLEMSKVDQIFTHFPADENDTVEFGRLGEEAKRIADIMSEITKDSLFLLNETYSTTSFSDGLYMAKDLVGVLSQVGVRTIYNTHMHELAEGLERWNKKPGKAKVASLVMGIESGKRSYVVTCKEPDADSYARDIAERYGVTYERLMMSIQSDM